MSKPHLDSWVKYTGQRNLWDPEKLTYRMKRSCLPLSYSAPASPFFTCWELLPLQPPGAHSAWWCCWAWHHPTEKIECHLIMQPSCGKHGVCNQIDRRGSQNPLCEADKVRREQRMVAPGATACPKNSLRGRACLSAPDFSTDLQQDRFSGGWSVHLRGYRPLWKYHQLTFAKRIQCRNRFYVHQWTRHTVGPL